VNRLLCGILVLLTVGLVACAVPGATRPTVKIGLVAPFEGRYREVGYSLFAAVRLALREINAAGGIGERNRRYSVELIAYDDGADPDQARQQAEKLAVDPQVVVVIGHFREETTRAAQPVYAAEGLPMLAPAVTDPALTAGNGVVIRIGPDADEMAARMLEGVSGTAGLIGGEGPLGRALQRAADAQGISLHVFSPDGPPLPDHPPSPLFCDAPPADCGEVLAALRARGWQGEFIGRPDLALGEFTAVAGEAAMGARMLSPWPFPQQEAGCADFVAECARISLGIPPGPLALPAYQAARRALEALAWDIATHNRPTRAGVTQALASGAAMPLPGGPSCPLPATPALHWYRLGANGWQSSE